MIKARFDDSILERFLMRFCDEEVGGMSNRRHGSWMSFSDSQGGSLGFARIHPGNLSTCAPMPSSHQPAITNGRIGSVSDITTISPQTAPIAPVRDLTANR